MVQQLTYTYSRKVHCSTGMTAFSLLLTLKPPGPSVQDLSKALLHDVSQPEPAKILRLHILYRLSPMRTKADKTLKVFQSRYKPHFSESVRSLTPLYQVGYLYVDRSPTSKLQLSIWQTNCDQNSCRNPSTYSELPPWYHTPSPWMKKIYRISYHLTKRRLLPGRITLPNRIIDAWRTKWQHSSEFKCPRQQERRTSSKWKINSSTGNHKQYRYGGRRLYSPTRKYKWQHLEYFQFVWTYRSRTRGGANAKYQSTPSTATDHDAKVNFAQSINIIKL